jgi:hypothetical protein
LVARNRLRNWPIGRPETFEIFNKNGPTPRVGPS